VVLPAPFGPITEWISPASTDNETPSTAFTPPKLIDRFLTESSGATLGDLVAAVESVPVSRPLRERLTGMISSLLEAYRHAYEEHQIQISDMKRLSEERKQELVVLEPTLVRVFSDALAALNPALANGQSLLKPLTMNLFGMMNWKFMWFKANGPVTHDAFAELVMTTIEAGAIALTAKPVLPETKS
jgi:TetR/AcrR family transcriptional regulator